MLNSFERALVGLQSIKAGPKKSSHAATADERVLDGLEAQHQYEATLINSQRKTSSGQTTRTDNNVSERISQRRKPTNQRSSRKKKQRGAAFRLLQFINGREGPSWAMPH